MTGTTALRPAPAPSPGPEPGAGAAPWWSPDRAYYPLAILGTLPALVFDLKSLLFDASLRYDEINVLVSIVDRPYRDLHPPLDYAQTAPVGWLWLTRAVYGAFGREEIALRAPSLVCTAAALALVIVLARRVLPAPAALAAVALVATNFYVNFYSYNVKPYALDMACTVALVLAGLAVRRGTGNRRRAVFGWWALATVTALLSFPAIFAAAAVAVVLVLDRLRRGGLRAAALLALGGVPFVAATALHYLLALRASAGNSYLYSYFAGAFPPPGARLPELLDWAGQALHSYAATPFTPGAPYVGLVLGVLGAAALLRRHPGDGAVVLAPVVIGFVLAAATVYPMAQRMGLYALPLVAVAAGALVDRPFPLAAAWRARGRWRDPGTLRAVAALAVCWLLVAVVVLQAAVVFTGQQRGRRTYAESRQLIAALADRIRPGDVVLAAPDGEPAFRFYGPRFGVAAPAEYVTTTADGRRPCVPDALDATLAGARRVWMVFAFAPPPEHRAELYRALFRRLGTPVVRLTWPDADAAAYDLVAGPAPAPGDAAVLADQAAAACLAVVPRPLPFPPPA
jgi:hypothetical protein